jgi:hypothetical protein
MKYLMRFEDFIRSELTNDHTLSGLSESKISSKAKELSDRTKKIKTNILSYIERHRPNSIKSSWYVGITNNIDNAKGRHKRNFVLVELPEFYYWECENNQQAEILENYLIKIMKFSGYEGGGTENTNLIYVWFKGRKNQIKS